MTNVTNRVSIRFHIKSLVKRKLVILFPFFLFSLRFNTSRLASGSKNIFFNASWACPEDYLLFTLLTWSVSGHIFFWDTVQLGAKHGLFYFETNFSKILLPDYFDSGHIPTFGMYLAFCWKIFGKNLFVSHFVMLPFLYGIVWQAYLLLKKYIQPKYIYMALALFLADATLLSQATLVTPDIPLVFLFLLGLNSILSQRKGWILVACVGLVLVSMRGMMVAFALLIIDVVLTVEFKSLKQVFIQLIRKSVLYFPSLFVFLSYNFYHLKVKGWIGYHDGSPWAEHFKVIDFMGFLRNVGLLFWRMIDFGRISVFIFVSLMFLLNFKKIIKDKIFLRLGLIFVIVLTCLSISFVFYTGLSGHRYLLPVYFAFSLIGIYLLFNKISNEKLKIFVFLLLLIGLLSGNFWMYPERISQGWDSSLAHVPYYQLRDKMLLFLEDENIEVEDVACVFPNKVEFRYLELNDNLHKHCDVNLDINKYVIYSNIYNDFSDDEVDRLKTDFIVLKEYKKIGVFIRLYMKK